MRIVGRAGSAASAPSATPPVRPIRGTRGRIAALTLRRRVLRRRCLRSRELLQSTCGVVELLAIDVRVASHGREVGVSEVLGDEAGVAALLPQPGCGGVAKRVGGDVLLDPGSRRGASDDVGEDRLL